MFERLINRKVKLVVNEVNTASVYYGFLRAIDENTLVLENSEGNEIIVSLDKIIKIEELSGGD